MMTLARFMTFPQNIYKCKKLLGLYLRCSTLEVYPSPRYWKRDFKAYIQHCNNKGKPLTDSEIMVQDGTYILEMPCVVQIINGDFEISSNGKTVCGEVYEGLGLEYHQVPKSMFRNVDFEEEAEMKLGFMRCNSLKELFNLLNICPEEEITPSVAVAVIRRIFDLENNIEYRNSGFSPPAEESNITFTRAAVMKRLIETVCSGSDPQIVIDALRSMSRDCNKKDNWNYVEQLCTESIILATDGKLSISQICELIKAFYNLVPFGKEYIDKVWVGLNEKQESFQVEELCYIVSVLPLVKTSRPYLYNYAERRLYLVWRELQPDHVIRIAHILVQLKMTSSRLLGMISQWSNLNIHILTEGNLRWIVYCFLSLKYTDDNFQKCLGRYLKAKKVNIRDHSLVGVILDYCIRMRIRNTTVLDCAAEYFVFHSESVSTSQITSIMTSFGYLNYTPPNGYKFFSALEAKIHRNFSQFAPNDLLDILLSCTYLQRYPLNFVNKVFNPNFFDRIHSLDDKEQDIGREKLVILDSALTLEASSYNGPLLPSNLSRKIFWQDARIIGCINKLKYPLIELIGNSERISSSVLLPDLPASSFYMVDIMVDLSGKLFTSKLKPFREKYAFLIHLPEHFDMLEGYLTGPQAMKMRHLERIGFVSVSLNYNALNSLFSQPKQLENYMKAQMVK